MQNPFSFNDEREKRLIFDNKPAETAKQNSPEDKTAKPPEASAEAVAKLAAEKLQKDLAALTELAKRTNPKVQEKVKELIGLITPPSLASTPPVAPLQGGVVAPPVTPTPTPTPTLSPAPPAAPPAAPAPAPTAPNAATAQPPSPEKKPNVYAVIDQITEKFTDFQDAKTQDEKIKAGVALAAMLLAAMANFKKMFWDKPEDAQTAESPEKSAPITVDTAIQERESAVNGPQSQRDDDIVNAYDSNHAQQESSIHTLESATPRDEASISTAREALRVLEKEYSEAKTRKENRDKRKTELEFLNLLKTNLPANNTVKIGIMERENLTITRFQLEISINNADATKKQTLALFFNRDGNIELDGDITTDAFKTGMGLQHENGKLPKGRLQLTADNINKLKNDPANTAYVEIINAMQKQLAH